MAYVPPMYAADLPPVYAADPPPVYAADVPPVYAADVPPVYAADVPPVYAADLPPVYAIGAGFPAIPSTDTQTADTHEAKRLIFAICALCCLMLLVSLLGFMVLGSEGDEEAAEQAEIIRGGGGGGSDGGPSPIPTPVQITAPQTPGPSPLTVRPTRPPPTRTPGISSTAAPTPSPTTTPTPIPTTTPTPIPTTTPTPTPTTTPTPTPTTTSPPPTPPPTTRITTTTQTPFSVDQLICTVGDTAIFDRMVPLDGLCHYIYYTNIVVQKGELTAIKVSVSWNTFKAVLSGYKKTTGGIGFDVRYVDVTDLSAQVQGKLNDLYLRNVKHYGILNALETSKNLTDIFTKAKGLLKKLKNFQVRDDTQKTLLAFGIYNYLEDGAWETLQEVFASAVNDSVADTVIAYSSVGWIEGPDECFSHPPSIFNKRRYLDEAFKEAGRAPDILGVSRMMTRDKEYKSGVKMGLSFELGTLVYEVNTPTIPLDMVNAPCKTMYITSMDVLPCRVNPYNLRGEVYPGVNLAEVRGQNTTIMLFEDEVTVREKCIQLADRSTNLRPGMALLLVNAHLGDLSTNSTCKDLGERDREDPFWRIRVIKAELKIP